MMTPSRSNEPNLWNGLIQVYPQAESDILEGAKGAFVQAFLCARSFSEFENGVARALESIGLLVVSVEDATVITEDDQNRFLSDDNVELDELAKKARASGEVTFTTFFGFENSEDS
jgi:hypothetical protein